MKFPTGTPADNADMGSWRWLDVLSFAAAFVVLQPVMFAVNILMIWPVLGGNTIPAMMTRSILLSLVGLLVLIAARKPLRRHPGMMQVPVGLLLAPVSVCVFWYVFGLLK
jgi:hypothetical protein